MLTYAFKRFVSDKRESMHKDHCGKNCVKQHAKMRAAEGVFLGFLDLLVFPLAHKGIGHAARIVAVTVGLG